MAPYDAIHVGAAAPTVPEAVSGCISIYAGVFYLLEVYLYMCGCVLPTGGVSLYMRVCSTCWRCISIYAGVFYLLEVYLYMCGCVLPTGGVSYCGPYFCQLIEQLAEGGRMIIPVGPEGGNQHLQQIDKDEHGHVTVSNLMGVIYIPLTSKERQCPSGYMHLQPPATLLYLLHVSVCVEWRSS